MGTKTNTLCSLVSHGLHGLEHLLVLSAQFSEHVQKISMLDHRR